jgi:hypothetical protein
MFCKRDSLKVTPVLKLAARFTSRMAHGAMILFSLCRLWHSWGVSLHTRETMGLSWLSWRYLIKLHFCFHVMYNWVYHERLIWDTPFNLESSGDPFVYLGATFCCLCVRKLLVRIMSCPVILSKFVVLIHHVLLLFDVCNYCPHLVLMIHYSVVFLLSLLTFWVMFDHSSYSKY